MIEVWRGRQRKARRSEVASVVHHFAARPDNPLEVAGVGPLRRFDEYELLPGGDVPLYISLLTIKVVIVLEGELTHQRPGRAERTLVADDVLVETGAKDAGVRLLNPSADIAARFLLLGLRSAHEVETLLRTVHADPKSRAGTAWPVLSGQDHPEAIPLPLNLAVYLFTVRRHENLIFETVPDRSTYLHLVSGSLRVGGEQLQTGDSARLRREGSVQLTATSRSEGVLVDVSEADSTHSRER